MLKISQSSLPQSLLSYVAFRVAFRATFERLLVHRRHSGDVGDATGYLAEVPFLREVPLQVQLDLLADTWQRHLSRETHTATLIDESIIYAACEFATRLLERDPELFLNQMRGGPIELSVPVDAQLGRELRLLYLELPNDGDFLLVSQFLDLEPTESARQKIEMGINPRRLDAMFEQLGRWHVSPQIATRLTGLLTDAERAAVMAELKTLCRDTTRQH
jgi:hypothetical protein